jgi:hypothetical protein
MPGETVTIRPRGSDGKETGEVMTFTRTNRPYVYDLCDCYNAYRKRDDVEWYVTEAQELKIGRPSGYVSQSLRADKERAEAERKRADYIKHDKMKSFAWNAGYHLRELKRAEHAAAHHGEHARLCRDRANQQKGGAR